MRDSKWPLGLLGMVAILVAVEGYIASRGVDLGTMYSIEWKMTGHAIRHRAKGSEVLCFGTSLTRMGVSPRVIEEVTGMPAYNLALSGAQPFAAYEAFRLALESGVRPKAVVVDFMWSAIGMDYTWNERVLPEMAPLGDCLAFAWQARDSEFLGRLALVWALPSYRCKVEARANVLAATRGVEPERNSSWAIMARNALANRGATHTPRGSFAGVVNPADEVLFPKDWTCPPMSARYVRAFFALAEEHGIPAFWLIQPLPPATGSGRDAVGATRRYAEFVATIRAEHPEVSVVDGTGSRYTNEAFYDSTHLNRDGAVALSADLAATIKRRLDARAGGSWVRLPDYRPDPAAARIEDLEASRLAVAARLKPGATR